MSTEMENGWTLEPHHPIPAAAIKGDSTLQFGRVSIIIHLDAILAVQEIYGMPATALKTPPGSDL